MDKRGKLVFLDPEASQDRLDHLVGRVYLVHLVQKDHLDQRGIRVEVEVQVYKEQQGPRGVQENLEEPVSRGTRACTA